MTHRRPFRSSAPALAAAAALALAAGCGGGEGAGRTFVHAQVFVVTGSHQGLQCSDCHDPAKPSFALANGGVDCLHCHAQADVQPAHGGVAGFAYDSGSCIGCHKDGSGGLPSNHDAQLFPVTKTAHASFGCSQCHGATKQVADLRCVSCHDHDQTTMAAAHAAIPPATQGVVSYQWSSDFCVRCHADGQVNRIASHPGGDSGINSRHQPWCLNCHALMRPSGDKPWGADFGRTDSTQCNACHAARGVNGG